MSKFNVQPYQFEPTYPEGEEPLSSDSEVEEDDEESEGRKGNTDWCSCDNCIVMGTDVESLCCQELDVLNDKFDDSG